MAGIYLHIPFCKQACHYCNFHFSTSLQLKNDFLDALLKEIQLQKEYLGTEMAETIYFGGGTPSLLQPGELKKILDTINQNFTISNEAEITLEANPDDIDMDTARLAGWRKAGINRLSIGIQSFREEDLRWMNRAHSAVQATESIRRSQDAGFDNLTIDLIYGTPGLSDEAWQQNVEQAVSLNIAHLSCYALTVEEGTALASFIKKNKTTPVNPDDQARQFTLLINWLENAGYEHYEISNFALPEKRSRHNSSYWQGKHYLGLGPSAHSFNGHSRQWNITNNALYIQSLRNNTVSFEKEELTATQQLNEYIMTRLRTMEGISMEEVTGRFGRSASVRLEIASRKFISNKTMWIQNDHLRLTKEGKLFADGIAAELFNDDADDV
jgi:oxygen-independent coproporphyrinogen-3 oxidase